VANPRQNKGLVNQEWKFTRKQIYDSSTTTMSVGLCVPLEAPNKVVYYKKFSSYAFLK